jgi:hypothetical protein
MLEQELYVREKLARLRTPPSHALRRPPPGIVRVAARLAGRALRLAGERLDPPPRAAEPVPERRLS